MKKQLLTILAWCAALYFLAATADWYLAYAPSFPYADAILAQSGLPRFMYSWANFDGVHYLTIIEHGYKGTGLIQAFFPLYPGLVVLDGLVGIHPIVSGQIISIAAFFGAYVLWKKVLSTAYSPNISQFSRKMLLFFPTSFFFMAMYTESLFLLLVLGSFYFAQKKQWAWAVVCAALASSTKVVGIALVPALLVEYLEQRSISLRELLTQPAKIYKTLTFTDFTKMAGILLGGTGLFLYMGYLYFEFKDPLYFFSVQSEFGGGRSESLVLLPQVVVRYLKILATVDWRSLAYLTYLQEFVFSCMAGAALVYGYIRKHKLSHLVFGFFVYTIPTLTGTFSSMPRYILVCVPFFIVLAQVLEKRPRLRMAWYVTSTILLVINTILFIQGYWVA